MYKFEYVQLCFKCDMCCECSFPYLIQGCWDVFQWWGPTFRASNRSTRGHWEIMGEMHIFKTYFDLKMNNVASQGWVTVIHTPLLHPGNSPFWDKGGNESQLLIERCGQPHSLHQNQNQRPQWGSVHHPSCRGGGHIRCAAQPCYYNCFRHCCRSFMPAQCRKTMSWIFIFGSSVDIYELHLWLQDLKKSWTLI